MQDGLLITEHHLAKLNRVSLMVTETDVRERFEQNSGAVVQNILHSRSPLVQTTVVQGLMQEADKQDVSEESAFLFGNEWVHTKDECDFDSLTSFKFEQVPRFGISNRQVVSYLDASLSTKSNMLQNEKALADLDDGSFRITNNVELLMEASLRQKCGDDLLCAGYFGLCFSVESYLLNCNGRDPPSLSKVFIPKQE